MDKHFARTAFMDWLRIRQRADGKENPTVTQLIPDIGHSALLDRLLDEKEIFADPPPRAFSYPWYELIEQGHGLIHEPPHEYEDGTKLLVNQSMWNIRSKNFLGWWSVQWQDQKTMWVVRPRSEEDDWCSAPILDDGWGSWVIERWS